MKNQINELLENSMGQILLLFACMIGFGIYSALLGQDINWDLKQYHFYNGYAYLHHRFDKDIGPAMVQTYINPFFDVINYLLIAIQKPILTEFLLGSFSGISAFVLYKIATLLFANVVSIPQRAIFVIFSLIIGMTGTNTISLLNTTTNDNKMGLLVILSLYFLLKGVTASQKTTVIYLFLSAFLAGLVVGFKLPAVCYAIGLCAALLSVKNYTPRPHYTFVLFLLLMGCGFLLANGYWMVLLYKHFLNPIFPYYNNIFHSPYAPFISFNLSSGHTKLYVYHYFLLPFYLAFKNNLTSEPMRDARLAIIFLLGMGVICRYFFWKKNETRSEELPSCNQSNPEINKPIQIAWHIVFIFFFVSYLLWLVMFMVYRYLLPLELVMGLIIAHMTRSLFTVEVMQRILLVILSFIFIVTTCYTDRNNKRDYHKEFFSLTAPQLPADSIIFLTTVPLSFVIPFFPENIRFVGMPFVGLGIDAETNQGIETKKLLMDVNKLIHTRESTLFTLSFQQSDRFDKKTKMLLNHLGLIQDEDHCKLFQTNIGDQLKMCPLKRSR